MVSVFCLVPERGVGCVLVEGESLGEADLFQRFTEGFLADFPEKKLEGVYKNIFIYCTKTSSLSFLLVILN